jgi:hypothetical protein
MDRPVEEMVTVRGKELPGQGFVLDPYFDILQQIARPDHENELFLAKIM